MREPRSQPFLSRGAWGSSPKTAARSQRREAVAARASGRALRLPVYARAAAGFAETVAAVQHIVPKTFVYANNHPNAQAVANALQLKTLCRASFVTVMETADFRTHDDGSDGCLRGRSAIGRVLLECEVRSALVIVPDAGREDARKMRLVQDDHVIEALAPDRADHAFHVRILPRTRGGRHDLGDAHACDTAVEGGAIDAIAAR